MTTQAESRYFYPSGNVDFVGYSANNRILAVRYKGGAMYRYRDVPADVYDRLEAEHKRGGKVAAMVTRVVKEKGYDYEKVGA